MRLRIVHDTLYSYEQPVHALAMEARLQPCNDDFQSCQRYRLSVTPKPNVQEYTTFSEVTVYYWTLLRATELRVLSESIVDTRERPLWPVEAPPAPMSESDLVNYFCYLQPTRLTPVTSEIQAFADPFTELARTDWYQAALAVREQVYETLSYEPNSTEVRTDASEALSLRRGVCQDFAHLMIATMRALGIPCRYVSGYLNPHITGMAMTQTMNGSAMSQSMSMDSPDTALRGTGASHAWCEVYLGAEHGWRGFDPTNNLSIDQHYVRIGSGRDFNDLTPIKGVHRGLQSAEKMEVAVSVRPVN